MATRAYNNETRRQQQTELKARIAAAAAQLHAEKGAIATSYADIAQRAGVSLPTVYSHFRTQDELIGACTAHVASQAPEMPIGDILGAENLAAAAAALVEAMDRTHAHFEPWMAWGERRLIPALRTVADRGRKELTQLIGDALAMHLGPGDHREAAAVWESLLHFDLWHRMAREHRLPRATLRRTLAHLLVAAIGQQPAASPSPRPIPRK